jgi:GTPase SAR1 family protein
MHSYDVMTAQQPQEAVDAVNIDELIAQSLAICDTLPPDLLPFRRLIEDCRTRLSRGEIRLAVMGQFKRGKSTFINSLLSLDILPVSVVPVTSIPTVIRYGDDTSCTIRFLADKPDLVVRQSVSEIRQTLTTYVTEEKNPKNRLGVREAVVECPSAILQNGTVLIDTPGFGSTYVHNTQTTVDLIKGCDAVLFLLSADPPFTQTEVEFLKEVKRHVPRIFFILNKIDQISEEELVLLERFIKGVLVTGLGCAPGVTVFPVCARGREDGAASFDKSGMTAVKSGIIDFMVREKYFTLSQAISDRLKTALAGVVSLLSAQQRDLEEPLERARQQRQRTAQQCEQVRIKGERELALIDVETRALYEYLDKLLDRKKEDLLDKIKAAVVGFIDGGLSRRADPVAAVRTAFPPLSDEMFRHLYLQISHGLGRPFRKAIELPRAEFVKTVRDVKTAVPSVAVDFSETLEPSCDLGPFPFSPEMVAPHDAFDAVRRPSFSLFMAAQEKRRRYEELLVPASIDLCNQMFEQLSLHVKNTIRRVCDGFKHDLADDFGRLHGAMTLAAQEIEDASSGAEVQAQERLAQLAQRKKALSDIVARLV